MLDVHAVYRVVRPRLTIYVCQESQQAREQQPKHENGDAAANTFFGQCMFVFVVTQSIDLTLIQERMPEKLGGIVRHTAP